MSTTQRKFLTCRDFLSLDLDTHIAAPVVTQSDLSQQRKQRRVQADHTGDDPLQDVHDFVLHYVDSPRFY